MDHDANTAGWNFDNTYSRLPERFFSRVKPTSVLAPAIALFNDELAVELGLSSKALKFEAAQVLSGKSIPTGAEPLAQAYAGHQFGHPNMLGDGRAVLLGEHVTPSGVRYDIQLKGSGPTPYSRRGDGRATLSAMLREYLISEAMNGLKIPTTRSLAVITTGERVRRETILPGAVLTRVASSHIRVGTFEFAAATGDLELLRSLADYTIDRHYPEAKSGAQPYLALLNAVIERQASLISKWMLVGFIHGVMNTDNMALSGETIDYGPCAFMDTYAVATVFSSIDENGRYAFGNQPPIAEWNLTRFAETLLPLIDSKTEVAIEKAQDALKNFAAHFGTYFINGMRAKLGLSGENEEDIALITTLL
ncbi:MAG: YdiU family protein, partial [Proteobacteria bacterium]